LSKHGGTREFGFVKNVFYTFIQILIKDKDYEVSDPNVRSGIVLRQPVNLLFFFLAAA
jgi:hypothetical protein